MTPPASSVHHSALRALKHGSWSCRVLLRASRFRVQFKLDPSIHSVAGSLRGWVGGAGRCSSYLGTVLIPRNSTFQGSRTNMLSAHVSFNTTLFDMSSQKLRIAFESISLRSRAFIHSYLLTIHPLQTAGTLSASLVRTMTPPR